MIDYVTQRTESMMGLAYLLTLYAAIRGWTAVAIALCALGMLTEGIDGHRAADGAALRCVFVSGGVGRRCGNAGRGMPGWPRPGHPVAVVRDRPSLAQRRFLERRRAMDLPAESAVGHRRLSAADLWPTDLLLDYGLPHPIALAEACLPPSSCCCWPLTAVAWFRRRELAYLGVWFFVTLSPTSSFVPIATEVGAERRMYLPLAALVTWRVAFMLASAGSRRVSTRREPAAAANGARHHARGGRGL